MCDLPVDGAGVSEVKLRKVQEEIEERFHHFYLLHSLGYCVRLCGGV
jgi:hypothetical protein